MITEIPFAMVPRNIWTDPDNGRKWLHFEYDGTYQGYKNLPHVIKMDNVFFVKTCHNSDTMNVTYRQAAEKDIAFYKLA